MESKKINCSFCDKEIECPEDMMKYDKHACYSCFKKIGKEIPEDGLGNVHVDMPPEEMDPEEVVAMLGAHAFQDFWKETKDELKSMSKKEAVETSFMNGCRFIFEFMRQSKEGHDPEDFCKCHQEND